MSTPSDARAIILTNGHIADYPALARLIKPNDTFVCADGGLRHARALNVTPRILVGDLDSVTPDDLDSLGPATEIQRYPAEKDQTDLEIAMHWTADQGFAQILVAGVTGGRLDHSLANILLLAQRPWGGELCFWDHPHFAWLLAGDTELALGRYVGYTVSLLPLSPRVVSIRTHGMQYPLADEDLTLGSTRGISNVIAAAEAGFSMRSGRLLAIVTPPDCL
ncbi:MAG TPA: thiamine diphosphokinase [Gammaproteobacteria bacterium]|nr:thiamine diphosphokinase [Gammaproteobacteria bacterium]